MVTPSVSVVIPVYNHERYVAEAIKSVLDQSCHDIEVIVVDDESTDCTPEVVRGFCDPRVRYIWQPHQGVSAARNRGVRIAKGSYIALLDSDDVWLPQKLSRELDVFRTNSRIGLVYCGISYTSETLEIHKTIEVTLPSDPLLHILALREPVIPGAGSTIMVKREVFCKVGNFDTRLPPFEVWDFYRRIACHYPFGVVHEPLVFKRSHGPVSLHRNVELTEYATPIVLKKAFADPSLPKGAMRLKSQGYTNHYSKIAELFLNRGEFRKFAYYSWCAVKFYPPRSVYLSRIAVRIMIHLAKRRLVHLMKNVRNVTPIVPG